MTRIIASLFDDVGEICRLHDRIEDLDARATPSFEVIVSPRRLGRLGFLAGSFNPPTLAHTRLAARAQRFARLSAVCYVLSKVTVNKEQPSGARIEDRLLALCRCAGTPSRGLALCNRGLYVDQAIAAQRAFPDAQLFFIVGYDKLVQILDPHYYEDRDASLEALLCRTTLLVAARSGQEQVAFEQLMARPENRAFRPRIDFLPFPRYLQDLSSTKVRRDLAAGNVPASRLPRPALDLVTATAAYLPPLQLPSGERIDRYELRARLIETLLCNDLLADGHTDLPGWLRLLWADTSDGRELRRLLDRPGAVVAAQLAEIAARIS